VIPSVLPDRSRPAPVTAWGERWFNLRNRLLASPAFHRLAAGFIFTRPIARARAASLFDLVAGFVYSQVLLACVRLDLFELLAQGPRPAAELALAMNLEGAAADRLLAAAASLRLLERRTDGSYGLGVLGAPMVGNHALRAMIEHHTALYADLADPVALLRGGPAASAPSRLGDYWPYAATAAPDALPAAQVTPYSHLMAASQPLVADQVLDAHAFTRHRRVLDIGGGDGSFLLRAAQRAPQLQLVLFDLPAVAQQAHQRFQQAGLGHRAQAVGGDFKRDPLPQGADLITLLRVVHDHDDGDVRTLLSAAFQALAPGGTLLLAEPMAGTAGAQAMGDAYFGFYLLAMGSGRPRTAPELEAMLHMAGFQRVRQLPTRMPLQARVIEARKPFGPSTVNTD
jgi:demethylspheroidene O-methyltransferase